MGGSGEGTNPEQLFSAGYAAASSVRCGWSRGKAKIELDDATGVTVEVGFGKDSEGGFGMTANHRLPARASSRASPTTSSRRRTGVPVLEGHPGQHRRRHFGEGLSRCGAAAASMASVWRGPVAGGAG